MFGFGLAVLLTWTIKQERKQKTNKQKQIKNKTTAKL